MHLSNNGRLTAPKKKEISIQILQIFNKKEDFFLNNSSSEYRNKPNRDENANTKRDMLGLKYGKKTRHQIEAIIQKAEAEVKLEITATDEIKAKALKELYFRQKVTKQKHKK